MKKYLFSVLAIGVAVGFSAFTSKPPMPNRFTSFFFVYQLTSQNQSDLDNPANYKYTGITPTCGGSTNECAVEVTIVGTPPANPSTLANQPSNAVTFDPTTGIPDGGTEFFANEQKN